MRLSCLHYALHHREDSGTWGGYNVDELSRLRRSLHVRATAPAAVFPGTLETSA